MRPDQIQPEMYEKQLQVKQAELAKLMVTLSLPEMEVYASQPSHYRMRAEFRIISQLMMSGIPLLNSSMIRFRLVILLVVVVRKSKY